MAGVVGTHLVAQVGFIVKNIEETKRKWAEFLGVDVPETQPCGDYEIMQTVFEKITGRLKDFTFSDITESFGRLRQIKSSFERRTLEAAAEYTDHGIAGAVHHVSRNGAKSEEYLTEERMQKVRNSLSALE